jgi:hypothetical protein
MPLAWTVAAIVVILGCAVVVGVATYGSESAGVTAASIAALPVGFVLGAAPSAWVVHFASRNKTARGAVPPGCGCLSSIGFALVVFAVLATIFR